MITSIQINTLTFTLICIFVIGQLKGQNTATDESTPSPNQNLFGSDEILDLTLIGDTKSLFNDRSNQASYHPMEISYKNEEGQIIRIPLKCKTRGNFRRKKENCFYPPILLNFSKKKTPLNSLFHGQDKMKLVTPCRDQKYVVREYLVYKLYSLITENSFRVRLVRVIYADTRKGKETNPLYGIILEEQDQMAERNSSKIIKYNGLRPNKADSTNFLTMAVFEFMIGNTDWSTQYRHNIKLLRNDTVNLPICVPYDFDHAGIVYTPYAKPAPALQMKSIRERRFRGYCLEDLDVLNPVFKTFNDLRQSFEKVYKDSPQLEKGYVRQTLKFIDGFFEIINDPNKKAKAFNYPCLENGTGKIVIRGLRGLD